MFVIHKEKKLTNIFCSICDANFPDKKQLAKHVAKFHKKSNNGPVQQFKKQSDSILERKGDPYKCRICKSCFDRKNWLANHITEILKIKKPFEVKMCEICFSRKPQIEGHTFTDQQKLKFFYISDLE